MEQLQPLYDWLRDELNYKLVRILIALLGIPGAILGIYRLILWLQNRSMEKTVEEINQTVQRIQETLDGTNVYQKPFASPTQEIVPKSAQAQESTFARDERVGQAFALLQRRKPADWADYILVVIHRQREALLADGIGKKETQFENLLGTPENPTRFRSVLKDLLTASIGEKEVVLRVHLTPGHAALPGLEATLNGGALLLVKQEPYWRLKSKSIPNFKMEGIRYD